MKTSIKWMSISLGRKLGLVASIFTLLGGFNSLAANYLIVNETYDPPTLATPGGWQNGVVTDLSRQYVNQGVGGSTALQVSATFPSQEGYCDVAAGLFQSGVMGGNEWATRENTVLSFDIKIDQPGLLNVDVYLDAVGEYSWNYGDFGNGHYTASVGTIPLGHYQPGVFKRIVLPLNDPRLAQNSWPDPNNMPPLFDPSARTYNSVVLTVSSQSFASLPASFSITVDNVQISTKNAMVPFNGTHAGWLSLSEDLTQFVSTSHGVAEHIGSFDLSLTLPYDFFSGPGTFELTAANGDKLSGAFNFDGFCNCMEIENGTGRFAGAVGSFRGSIVWGGTIDQIPIPFTIQLIGGISSVGSSK